MFLKSQQKREACVEPRLSRSALEFAGLGRARAGGRPWDPFSSPSERALVRRLSQAAAGYWRPLLVGGLGPGSSGDAVSIFYALFRRGRLTEGRPVAPSASREPSGTSFFRFRFSLKLLRCTGPGKHPVLL